MIKLDQIEEWIHEVEERPGSAPLIIQYVANRLRDLSARNEELLAENIELRTGRKVEDYESRIANLEYQLEILKRQLGGEGGVFLPAAAAAACLLVYNPKGRVIRVDLPVEELQPGALPVHFTGPVSAGGPPRMVVTSATEELLFVFDSGRTESLALDSIPASAEPELSWQQGHTVEARGSEELAFVLPVGKMSLFDYCVQTSRRGCAKKMMKSSFESAVSKSFVGAGVKAKPDRTCSLTLCCKEDLLVLATREGFMLAMEVSQLPYTIEEILKLSATDYIVSSFITGQKSALLTLTANGKAIHREMGWLEKPASFKSRGQAAFSPSRREAGARVAGAAAMDPGDWGAALTSDGGLHLVKAAELIESGALPGLPAEAEILEFTAFQPASGAKSAAGGKV